VSFHPWVSTISPQKLLKQVLQPSNFQISFHGEACKIALCPAKPCETIKVCFFEWGNTITRYWLKFKEQLVKKLHLSVSSKNPDIFCHTAI